ncbi:DUF945 family protein [Kushneria phosphatilytica]|uniref:DUF945 domain-containing protein n=1 Tax=Kushneria phosphatilytica TaxID=657387 RepID=A0A1S1NUK5_9GAMM|nr:DUF945 family protein [Kushneria phosphatilytica]OHV09727.1 hypothetical protein BH688_10845 [Kushneria phosphatilytica]QEL11773.1 DUF945 domain-containing protein [Kushneria phosphatilytica]
MKKRVIGSVVIIAAVLGAAWLGGVAWSRHVFLQRLDETMAQLNASPALSADQRELDRGFFHTRGTLVVTWPEVSYDGRPVELVVPWQARHGILSTHFNGHADVRSGNDGPRLLADRLSPGHQAELSAVIHHFRRNGELEVTLPEQVGLTQGPRRALLKGAVLKLHGDEQSLALKGRFDALELADENGSLGLGVTNFSSRRQRGKAGSEAADSEQRVEQLHIEQLQMHPQGSLPVTLKGIHWQGHAERQAGMLGYELSSRVEGIQVSQQGLGSLKLKLSLERLGADAASRLVAGMKRELRRSSADTGDDWLSLIEPVQTSFFAMLSPSPQLTLSEFSVQSPMLDQPIRLNGQLTFHGEGVADTRVADLRQRQGMRAFLERLQGSLTLTNAPPLLALIVGQSPDQARIEFDIVDGEVRVNDQALMPLYRLMSAP